MDEVIFQEFKGTGNTEIVMDRGAVRAPHLPGDRHLADRHAQGREAVQPRGVPKVTLLRRALASLKAAEAMQLLTQRLAKYPSNEAFLADLNR